MKLPLALAASSSLLVLVCGCDSNVVDGGGGQGGETSSGTESSGSGCASFDNVQAPSTVTFRVRNETGLDVYLPGVCQNPRFSIETSPTPDPTVQYPPGSSGGCRQTCEVLKKEDPYVCDASECAPSSFLVPAGETRDVIWQGNGIRDVAMPAGCWFSDYPEATCPQIVAAPNGQYAVDIQGFSECAESCTCDADGYCNGDATGLEAFVEPTVFSYPSDIVEVVFEVCAFGCAGG